MKQGTRWLGLACLMALVLVIGVPAASADTLMMPPRDALVGTAVVVWGNTTLANGTAFSIDCDNDGSPEASGTVADQTYIPTTCTYASAGAKTAKLTVGSESATTTLTVHDPATLTPFQLRGIKVNLAIQDGLRWLYVNQDNRTGNFAGDKTAWAGGLFGANDYNLSYTSLVVLAFENHNYRVTNDNVAPSGLYQRYVVQRGLNMIFDNLRKVALSIQSAGDPCVGVPVDADLCSGLGRDPNFDWPSGYSTPIITLAVAGSGAPARTVAVPGAASGGFVSGRSYGEVLQRMVNTIVWGQTDANPSSCYDAVNAVYVDCVRGGWGYSLNSPQSDGSTLGWVMLALLDAGAAGATVPSFAATEIAYALLHQINPDGSLAYQAGYPTLYNYPYGNMAKTGVLLQILKLMGVPGGDARVLNALSYMGQSWDGYRDPNALLDANFNTYYPVCDAVPCVDTSVWPPQLLPGRTVLVKEDYFGCTRYDQFWNLLGSDHNKACGYGMFNAFKGLRLYGVNTLTGVARPAGPGSIPASDWYADYVDWLVANQVDPTNPIGGSWTSPGYNNPMGWSCCDSNQYGIAALAELILSPVALVLPSNLTLAPPTATNPVGTQHTVTATATAANGAPVQGANVTFTVISGPNVGTTGTAVTDANGNASFTYTSNGTAGTDVIQASLGTLTSNTVEKIWVEEPTPGGQGRMTGGGSVFTASGMRVTHGFELHCDVSKTPNNLQINWGKGNRFHLASLTSASCSDDPAITPNPPAAGFDTYVGEGTGSYNGQPGATVKFKLTDAGEPGKNDTAEIEVKVGSTTVLSVSGKLNSGNQQAHKD